MTVVENDIASATALSNHITAYNQAIADLESRKADKSALTTLDGEVLKSIAAGDGINVSTKANNSQTVSVKLNDTQTDNALVLNSNGLYFSKTIDCGTYYSYINSTKING